MAKKEIYTRDEIKTILHMWVGYLDVCLEEEIEPGSFDEWFDKHY